MQILEGFIKGSIESEQRKPIALPRVGVPEIFSFSDMQIPAVVRDREVNHPSKVGAPGAVLILHTDAEDVSSSRGKRQRRFRDDVFDGAVEVTIECNEWNGRS